MLCRKQNTRRASRLSPACGCFDRSCRPQTSCGRPTLSKVGGADIPRGPCRSRDEALVQARAKTQLQRHLLAVAFSGQRPRFREVRVGGRLVVNSVTVARRAAWELSASKCTIQRERYCYCTCGSHVCVLECRLLARRQSTQSSSSVFPLNTPSSCSGPVLAQSLLMLKGAHVRRKIAGCPATRAEAHRLDERAPASHSARRGLSIAPACAASRHRMRERTRRPGRSRRSCR
jgi:hypothetical protein